MAVGEPLKAKYKNSDLPPGCLDKILWHRVFIPTVAHVAGGENVHPWLIEDDTLILILTKAWNIIYADNLSLKNYKIVLSIMWYINSIFNLQANIYLTNNRLNNASVNGMEGLNLLPS